MFIIIIIIVIILIYFRPYIYMYNVSMELNNKNANAGVEVQGQSYILYNSEIQVTESGRTMHFAPTMLFTIGFVDVNILVVRL